MRIRTYLEAQGDVPGRARRPDVQGAISWAGEILAPRIEPEVEALDALHGETRGLEVLAGLLGHGAIDLPPDGPAIRQLGNRRDLNGIAIADPLHRHGLNGVKINDPFGTFLIPSVTWGKTILPLTFRIACSRDLQD